MRPLAFDFSKREIDGRFQSVAVFTCVDCGRTHDILIKTGKALNPESYAHQMGYLGWQASAVKRNRVFCPDCWGRKGSNDVDSELKKVVFMPPTPPAPAPVAHVTAIRPITPDQRVAIRQLLEKHFDDGAGMYLDGMSDEKIAEKLALPRISVEHLREAAYGPILVDPVIAGLRAEQVQLKRDIAECRSKLDALEARAMALGSQLERRRA